jgi:hypothetical protein
MYLAKSFIAATFLLLQYAFNVEAFGANKSVLFNSKVNNHKDDLDLTRRIILGHIQSFDETPENTQVKKISPPINVSPIKKIAAVGARVPKLKKAKHHLFSSSLNFFPSIKNSLSVAKFNTVRTLRAVKNVATKSTAIRQSRNVAATTFEATLSFVPTSLNLGDTVLPAKQVSRTASSFKSGNFIPLNRYVKEMVFLCQQM